MHGLFHAPLTARRSHIIASTGAKIPTLVWLDLKIMSHQWTHAYDDSVTRYSVSAACRQLYQLKVSQKITNTIERQTPLKMSQYSTVINVTTRVDNRAGCGGGVRISIHSYCSTMHHLYITTSQAHVRRIIAYSRRIIAQFRRTNAHFSLTFAE